MNEQTTESKLDKKIRKELSEIDSHFIHIFQIF